MKDVEKTIKECLSHDTKSGKLTWIRGRSNIPAGREAGCLNSRGYRQVGIDGKLLYVHRVAWFLYCGVWPEGEIDHINGDKLDNRIENLRDVSHRENQQNWEVHRDGKLVGCSYHKRNKKWQAYAWSYGKLKQLGGFDSELDAHRAYVDYLEVAGL